MVIDDKYLPEVDARIKTIITQIEESKTIIHRNTLIIAEATKSNKEDEVAASEFNVSQLIRKINVLEEELAKLSA